MKILALENNKADKFVNNRDMQRGSKKRMGEPGNKQQG